MFFIVTAADGWNMTNYRLNRRLFIFAQSSLLIFTVTANVIVIITVIVIVIVIVIVTEK